MTDVTGTAVAGTGLQGPVLILGARSDIGRAIAVEFAKAGVPVILAARDAASLEADVTDLTIRSGSPARAVAVDVLEMNPAAFFDSLGETPRTVVSVVGLLGDQATSAADPAIAKTVMDTNYIGPALLLGEAARRIEAAGGGCVVGISSVAGDRGRKTNYIYGSAKAGLTAFLSGLRHTYAGTAVRVVTVKPGFVDTQMTARMNLPKPLTAQPEEVARAVVKACRGGPEVIYVRPIWWVIMAIITHLPEFIFKKTKM